MSLLAAFVLLASFFYYSDAATYEQIEYGVQPPVQQQLHVDPSSTVTVENAIQACKDVNGYPITPRSTAELSQIIQEIQDNPASAGKSFLTFTMKLQEGATTFSPFSRDVERLVNVGGLTATDLFTPASPFERLIIKPIPSSNNLYEAVWQAAPFGSLSPACTGN